MQIDGSKNKLSVVIPCFNERENIPNLFDRLQPLIKSTDPTVEVIIVDGASTDGTPMFILEEIKRLQANSSVKLIKMSERKGYGIDILEGLKNANGRYLSWTHADLQTDPVDVLSAFRQFMSHEKPDRVIIKGRRLNRPWLDAFLTFGMQILVFFVLRIRLDDINAQPKMFSKDFFLENILADAPGDFSLDLYLLYKARKQQFLIDTVPVIFKDRVAGEAKGGGGALLPKIDLIKRTIKYIFKLRRHMSG